MSLALIASRTLALSAGNESTGTISSSAKGSNLGRLDTNKLAEMEDGAARMDAERLRVVRTGISLGAWD